MSNEMIKKIESLIEEANSFDPRDALSVPT